MRITLLNPNTSRAMTAKIAAAAREAAGPGVEIVAMCPDAGPAAVESHVDEVAAASSVLELIARDQRGGGSDGYVIACCGDPGLDAARELSPVPVVGIAEAAMHAATLVGRGFGIVTTLSRTLGRADDLVHRYGMHRACVFAQAADVGVLELEDADPVAVERIARVCERGVRDAHADVIVLGCAGMTNLCTLLAARAGVPVIDGVAAGVGMLAALVRMGISTSRRDEYAAPPARADVVV